MKLGPSEGILVPDAKSPNPFAQRPPSAAGGRAHAMDDPMAELDQLSHMPDGVEPSAWDRLVVARKRKVDSEQKVHRTWLIHHPKLVLYCVFTE